MQREPSCNLCGPRDLMDRCNSRICKRYSQSVGEGLKSSNFILQNQDHQQILKLILIYTPTHPINYALPTEIGSYCVNMETCGF